jgi:hypothetical protein
MEELGTKNQELDKHDEDCNRREPRGTKGGQTRSRS